jgi:hypothetical protein
LAAEFAAGSVTQDFGAYLGNGYAARAFTLNDGTTTLASTSAVYSYTETEAVLVSLQTAYTGSSSWGTGLDIELTIGSTETDTYAMSIDGTSVGNLPYVAPASNQVTKTYKVLQVLLTELTFSRS